MRRGRHKEQRRRGRREMDGQGGGSKWDRTWKSARKGAEKGFKNKIQEASHPPVHVDFVSHNSVMMEAHKKMGDYGIRHGSNIVCHPFFSFYEYAEARGQPIPRRNQRT
ncbi:hypothetical protein PRIPAC_96285 [Pristionchus pacificus]|uniref:Uncharacterized protein n=1 Tax=Pristionchus pacificus TaxID=54126 RepID=A0A2A6D1B0_PRIPA|nr:hypothetical protein PRIPAC_96285 [Pristionchus pacificus]|eukprot:PDM84097.1 hypothetical protein PRIPAC_34289 [Pristionchus pacificus]